jgi:hypothetical protein
MGKAGFGAPLRHRGRFRKAISSRLRMRSPCVLLYSFAARFAFLSRSGVGVRPGTSRGKALCDGLPIHLANLRALVQRSSTRRAPTLCVYGAVVMFPFGPASRHVVGV